MHDKFFTKYTIDIAGFVLKNKCNTDKSGLVKKIDDASQKISGTGGLVNPIQDGPFWGCSRMGVAKSPPFLNICHTYLILH